MKTLKEKNELIVNAKKLVKRYGSAFPVQGKKPAVSDWKNLAAKKQTNRSIEILFNRGNVTGIGIILTRGLHVLDIDGLKEIKVIKEILKEMGLPITYKHVVETGGGYHIYFYCEDDEMKIEIFLGGKKNYYVRKLKEQYKAKQMELRWDGCYVVGSYSLHPSGKTYSYYFGEPSHKPETVKAEDIIRTLQKFCIIDKNIYPQENLEGYDENKLLDVTNYLKQQKLGYPEWNKCGLALAQYRESGRKYFMNMSINKFYPDDTEEYLNKEFSRLLRYYKEGKITIATLFYIAKERGYKNNKNNMYLSREFLEYELCALSYPEKDNDKLLNMILNYAVVQKVIASRRKKKISNKLMEPIKKRLQIYISTNLIMKDHSYMKRHIESFKKTYGKQPYCRIGEDFFLETIQKRFDYMTFSILCTITAVQGKKARWKTITKNRIRAGISGYKSWAIMKVESRSNKTISDFQIRRRVEILSGLKIISQITVYKISYYSTFLEQNDLEALAKERYLVKVKQKVKIINHIKKYIEEIRAEKAKLILENSKKVEAVVNNKQKNVQRLSN